jgi:hypothetical protein
LLTSTGCFSLLSIECARCSLSLHLSSASRITSQNYTTSYWRFNLSTPGVVFVCLTSLNRVGLHVFVVSPCCSMKTFCDNVRCDFFCVWGAWAQALEHSPLPCLTSSPALWRARPSNENEKGKSDIFYEIESRLIIAHRRVYLLLHRINWRSQYCSRNSETKNNGNYHCSTSRQKWLPVCALFLRWCKVEGLSLWESQVSVDCAKNLAHCRLQTVDWRVCPPSKRGRELVACGNDSKRFFINFTSPEVDL